MTTSQIERAKEIDPLVEWAVFGHLDNKTDLELILLKGHLLLETILETVLKRNKIKSIDNYSFHRKIIALESIDFKDNFRKGFIVSSLREINKLRNKLAHEFHFDISNGDFEIWAIRILDNLKGKKFSKYTFRTKIVHSFSVLTKNILELQTLEDEKKYR
ncbi:MAG: hypothetical protein ACK44D_09865 [Bacteroidia bacterium]